jgi:hypothetical protein
VLGYTGILRDIFLILDGIQFFICIELALLFFIRGIKKKKGGRVNYGWGLVFSSFANIALMNIFLYYYLIPNSPELWYANIKLNSLIGGSPGLIIVAIMEKYYQKYHKTRFLFSGFYLSVSLITFFTNELLTSFFANLSLFVLGFFILIFFKTLIEQSSGATKKNVILFTIAFFLFMGGILLTNPRVIENQVNYWDLNTDITGLIARIGLITSLFIMAVVLLEQPVFYELNWQDKLVQLIVIQKKIGVHLFHTKFQDIKFKTSEQKEIQESLIAGGMTGITAMLKEISQSSEELKVIDHGDQKILLEHGEYIIIALNVVEELRIFWDKLKKLREIIETIWGGVIKDFDGILEYFTPLEDIVEREFS